MAKPGKKKKSCDKYRNAGRKAINADLRQERHRKKMERFAKRRAEGKNYEYKSKRGGGTIDNPANPAGPNITEPTLINERKHGQLPLAYWTSVLRKIKNEQSREAQETKRFMEKQRPHNNKKVHKVIASEVDSDD